MLTTALPRCSALAISLALVAVCAAQDPVFVTGISQPGAARLTTPDGDSRRLSAARGTQGRFALGTVDVRAGAELMLFTDSGVTVIAFGGARVNVSETDDFGAAFALEQGALLIITPAELNFEPGPRFHFDKPDSASLVPPPGRTLLIRDAGSVSVGFLSDVLPDQSVDVEIEGARANLIGGTLARFADGAVQRADWDGSVPSERSAARIGQDLGVNGAQSSAARLQNALFTEIIYWDQFAEKDYVAARIVSGRFSPEIRQVTTSVTQPIRRTTPPAADRGDAVIRGANSVPPLSPAALSVINIQAGVTAIDLNNRAAGLLTATGSQGLGFGGLRQLAIPGFLAPGLRSIGPAGLGATD